jgi:hypothetical protein
MAHIYYFSENRVDGSEEWRDTAFHVLILTPEDPPSSDYVAHELSSGARFHLTAEEVREARHTGIQVGL